MVAQVVGETPDGPISIESVTRQTVKAVDSRGFSIVMESEGTLVRMGGEEIRDTRRQDVTMVFDRLGKLLDVQGVSDKKSAMTSAAITRFVAPEKPVSINESWKCVYSNAKDSPNLRLTYRLTKIVEGIATVEVLVGSDDRARPVKGTGEWQIDTRTNMWKKFKAEVEDLDQSMTGKTQMTLTRQ